MTRRRTASLLLVLLIAFMLSSCELAWEKLHPAPKVGTVRVLAYGNDYAGGSYLEIEEGIRYASELYYTKNDALQVGLALKNLAIKADLDYQITFLLGTNVTPQQEELTGYLTDPCVDCYKDITYSRYVSELERLASEAQPEDLVIIFHSGHGYGSGGLADYGIDVTGSSGMVLGLASPYEVVGDKLIKATIMSDTLFMKYVNAIPGTKVVFCDRCYSGSLCTPAGFVSVDSSEYSGMDIVKLFFDSRSKIDVNASSFFVSASRYNEESWEHPDMDVIPHGYFTKALLEALGWNEDTGSLGTAAAEENGGITLYNVVRYVTKNDGKGEQTPMANGASNDIVLFSF